jgi:lysozyme family protein
MDRNFQRSLSLVLRHEGGWSDHKKDPGGATMKGVTLATFRLHVDATATKDDLRNITNAQLATVYRKHYWDAIRGDDLPNGVDYAVFDFAVNSGTSRAARYLQAAVNIRQDGKIGPQTLAAVKGMMASTLIHEICDKRMDFLRGLKTWPTFGKGWTRRVSEVRQTALSMVAVGNPVPAPKPAPVPPAPVPAPPLDHVPVEKPKTLWAMIKGWFGLA